MLIYIVNMEKSKVKYQAEFDHSKTCNLWSIKYGHPANSLRVHNVQNMFCYIKTDHSKGISECC